MPIDREQALKRAEKLLRQGRLEAAIAEYVQVVSDNPRDWTTANLLGDLYVRAGQLGAASQQYGRIAEHLAAEGFVAKAAAIYKKVIKLNPADEDALLRAAELASVQGLTADVRLFMTALFQLKLKRGDRDGAARLARKRVAFDPSDVVGRLDAARMLAEAGDQAGAAAELRTAGLALENQGRCPEAIRALREALRFAPGDDATRSALSRLLAQQGDIAAAADLAHTAGQLRELLAECRQRGLTDAARGLLVRLAEADPAAFDVRAELARASLDGGDVDGAVRWASVDGVAGVPALAVLLGEAYLLQGRVEEGQVLLAAALAGDAALRAPVSALADRLVGRDARAGAAALLAAVDASVERGETAWACIRLEAFVASAPDVVAVLRRHIDLCVDGGRDDELPGAQLRLTDALLRLGEFQEARIIAEDLVAAFPDDDRYRRCLALALDGLGMAADDDAQPVSGADDFLPILPDEDRNPLELSIDSVLSEDFSDLVASLSQDAATARAPVVQDAIDRILNSEAPADVSVAELPLADAVPVAVEVAEELEARSDWTPAAREDAAVLPVARAVPPDAVPEPQPDPAIEAEAPLAPGALPVDLLAVGDDLRRIFDGETAKPVEATAKEASFEIDLSDALAHIRPSPASGADAPASAPAAEAVPTLEGFFLELRDQAAERMAEGERLFREGEEAYVAGDIEKALTIYRAAAREPGVRFRASWAIARIAKERGHLAGAIEWLERASEVPATSPEVWQSLLYELGDTLVSAGEHARALAVFMELRAAMPGFRDVDDRIRELKDAQSGWDADTAGDA